MRVHEMLRYVAAFYKTWDHAYAEQLRRDFALDPSKRIKELSKGQRARVGLVAALAYRPDLLVLDEPSSGLDPIVRRDILGAIIRTIAERGRTVLFSSHLLTEIERVSDRIAMIKSGRVLFCDTPESIHRSHARVTLRFDEPHEVCLALDPRFPGKGLAGNGRPSSPLRLRSSNPHSTPSVGTSSSACVSPSMKSLSHEPAEAMSETETINDPAIPCRGPRVLHVDSCSPGPHRQRLGDPRIGRDRILAAAFSALVRSRGACMAFISGLVMLIGVATTGVISLPPRPSTRAHVRLPGAHAHARLAANAVRIGSRHFILAIACPDRIRTGRNARQASDSLAGVYDGRGRRLAPGRLLDTIPASVRPRLCLARRCRHARCAGVSAEIYHVPTVKLAAAMVLLGALAYPAAWWVFPALDAARADRRSGAILRAFPRGLRQARRALERPAPSCGSSFAATSGYPRP